MAGAIAWSSRIQNLGPKPLCWGAMRALKATVRNGRLLLDEPTDLQEGSVVPLEVADDWDELDDAERALLHDAIREGFEDAKAGRMISADEWITALRARV